MATPPRVPSRAAPVRPTGIDGEETPRSDTPHAHHDTVDVAEMRHGALQGVDAAIEHDGQRGRLCLSRYTRA